MSLGIDATHLFIYVDLEKWYISRNGLDEDLCGNGTIPCRTLHHTCQRVVGQGVESREGIAIITNTDLKLNMGNQVGTLSDHFSFLQNILKGLRPEKKVL